jgi:hypothetical protein
MQIGVETLAHRPRSKKSALRGGRNQGETLRGPMYGRVYAQAARLRAAGLRTARVVLRARVARPPRWATLAEANTFE